MALLEAFRAGAGFDGSLLLFLFAGVACVVVFLWATWALISLYKGYVQEKVTGGDFGGGALRVFFIIIILMWIVL